MTAIEFTFTGQRRDHPPLSTLTFDVVLRNHGDRPRWFLLPRRIGASNAPIDSSTSAVEVFSLPGTGTVLLGQFIGAPGFQALQLPAGAEVTVRGLEVMLAGELGADAISLEAVIGDSLAIGGEDAARWFERPPLSDARAEVTRTGATMLSGREAPDLKAQRVEVGGAERLTLSVSH